MAAATQLHLARSPQPQPLLQDSVKGFCDRHRTREGVPTGSHAPAAALRRSARSTPAAHAAARHARGRIASQPGHTGSTTPTWDAGVSCATGRQACGAARSEVASYQAHRRTAGGTGARSRSGRRHQRGSASRGGSGGGGGGGGRRRGDAGRGVGPTRRVRRAGGEAGAGAGGRRGRGGGRRAAGAFLHR